MTPVDDESIGDTRLALALVPRTPAPASGFEQGALIAGVYRLERVLGRGGMGVVFLARDEKLQRKVAIKLILPALVGPDFRERFTEEARAMARVNHANVAQVYAFDTHEGAPYIAMEFIEGRTMTAWQKECAGLPDLQRALEILDRTCVGVSAIHAGGTVHRDLKPANILLDEQLVPHIVDLGLAGLPSAKEGDPQITGTPAYVAPEIVFPPPVAPPLHLVDVYALGCIAYELLTGRPPFENATTVGLLLMHALTPAPPPSGIRPELAPFNQAILDALEKDPARRTPTVEQFRRDLLAARTASRDPAHILVVEDHGDFRDYLQIALADAFPGSEVECVKDGDEARAALERRCPSVAIFDLRLPGTGGLELTELLRSRAGNETTPILILTGSGGPADWQQLSARGADGFLVKPVNIVDVVALVRRTLVDRRRSSK